MSKKQLSAAQGIEAACILFQLNSKTADILRLAENAGLPSAYAHGPEQARLRAEWLAFVHAVVTAGLMQHAPNSVLRIIIHDFAILVNPGTLFPIVFIG